MPAATKVTDVFKKRGRAPAKGKAKAKATAVTETKPEEDADEEYLAILKRFDMTSKYGPALGLSRMERWDRAEKLNLSPPADVRRILEERKDDAAFAECVWERLV